MNIIKQIKRRSIPPCSQCEWNFVNSAGQSRCSNPAGLDLLEKLSGRPRQGTTDTERARATKYCNFKKKVCDD